VAGYNVDVDKIKAWLEINWVGPKKCPICKNSNWNISENACELKPYSGNDPSGSGPIYPTVAITCLKCGHILLFNAIVAGVIDEKVKKELEEERKNGK